MDEPQEKAKQESVYTMKGVPVKAYLSETGDFRWVPTNSACSDIEHAKEFLEVLQKMPADRREVWASRLDVEQSKKACPIIQKDPDICKTFDQLCTAYNKPKHKSPNKRVEVKGPNE